MLGGLAAAGTGIAQVFLLEGDAAGGHAGLFLHIQLALKLAAPHGLYEAALALLKLLSLLQRVGSIGVLVKVLLCLGVEPLLNLIKKLGDALCKLGELNLVLFAVVAADRHADTLFHILGAYLHAEGRTSSQGCCRRCLSSRGCLRP